MLVNYLRYVGAMNMKTIVSTVLISLCLAVVACAQDEPEKGLRNNTSSVVNGDKSIDITCSKSLIKLLIVTARDAGNHTQWNLETDINAPKKYVKFSCEAIMPWKAHLGSRGFTGLRSITVEIEKPFRVIIENAGETYISTLPIESDLLLANQVLWQTTISLKK